MSDHAERECEALFGSPYERIAELERELAAARKERDEALAAKQIMLSALNRSTETLKTASAGLAERDALAAALAKRGRCPQCKGTGTRYFCCERDDGTWGPAQTEKCECGGTDPQAILAAHDAALVEALQSAHDLAVQLDYVDYELRVKIVKILDAALAPYACRTCDGSGTVFDNPSAPCPACAKEVAGATE